MWLKVLFYLVCVVVSVMVWINEKVFVFFLDLRSKGCMFWLREFVSFILDFSFLFFFGIRLIDLILEIRNLK